MTFYYLNTHIKAVLRNETDTEQRPADETAAQALKYHIPYRELGHESPFQCR